MADLGGSVGQPVSGTESPPRCPALWHLDNWQMFHQGSLMWCRHSQNMGTSPPLDVLGSQMCEKW